MKEKHKVRNPHKFRRVHVPATDIPSHLRGSNHPDIISPNFLILSLISTVQGINSAMYLSKTLLGDRVSPMRKKRREKGLGLISTADYITCPSKSFTLLELLVI